MPKPQPMTWEAWREAYLAACGSLLGARWADLSGAEEPLRAGFAAGQTPERAILRWARAHAPERLPQPVKPAPPTIEHTSAAAAILGRTPSWRRLRANRRNAQKAGRTPSTVKRIRTLRWAERGKAGAAFRSRMRREAIAQGRKILERRRWLPRVVIEIRDTANRLREAVEVTRTRTTKVRREDQITIASRVIQATTRYAGVRYTATLEDPPRLTITSDDQTPPAIVATGTWDGHDLTCAAMVGGTPEAAETIYEALARGLRLAQDDEDADVREDQSATPA